MGAGFVLGFWLLIGGFLATISGAFLAAITAFRYRHDPARRKSRALGAAAYPFACMAVLATLFVFQAIINVGFLNRDIGIGDEWHTPLPGGYTVTLIDDINIGFLSDLKANKEFSKQAQVIHDIRLLQLAQDHIFGAIDSKAREHFGSDSQSVDRYFILDTRTRKRLDYYDRADFEQNVRKLGSQPNLEQIYVVFSKARFTWFDTVMLVLYLFSPIATAACFAYFFARIRHQDN
ncbi:MAG: hypothetical protein FJW36_03820 [Acidobacteria bacterium]|nr:hypothetical protein [Acidobacteriota bacterium]